MTIHTLDQLFVITGLIGALVVRPRGSRQVAFSRRPGAIGAGMPIDRLKAMSEVEWLLAGFAAGIIMSLILGQ